MSRRRNNIRRERRREARAASGPQECAGATSAVPAIRVTPGSPGPATAGQQEALEELRDIASAGDAVRVYLPRGPLATDGRLEVAVSLRCAGMPVEPGGVRLRARERVTVVLPTDVPLRPPSVTVTHQRFRDVPHVVWSELCLYRALAVEWDHAEGMYGFLTRLEDWFRAAAAGRLDPDGQPLHPPYAGTDPRAGLVVIRADAPVATETPWRGAALLRRIHPRRHDLVGWRRLGEPWPRTPAEAREAAGLDPHDDADIVLAPAVIATRALGRGTYPVTARRLLGALDEAGVPTARVLLLLNKVIERNQSLAGLHPGTTTAPSNGSAAASGVDAGQLVAMIVGDPTRGVAGRDGVRQANLVAWAVPGLAERMAALTPTLAYGSAETSDRAAELINAGGDELNTVLTRWVPIDDTRAEVTTRRDATTSAEWLAGKRILVLGIGALGAPIAEMCARGGAAQVTIVDPGTVRAGTLVRQPYTDGDLGDPKATALARRLRACRPDLAVAEHVGDATAYLRGSTSLDHDLIIDATAHRGLRAGLERERAAHRQQWPPHVTVLIGPTAKRGLATVSAVGASGGGFDILRRVGLTAHAAVNPTDTGRASDQIGLMGAEEIVADFFPRSAPRLLAPEPGCSDATFVGSAADVGALAGQMFAGVLEALAHPAAPMSALVVHRAGQPADPSPPGPAWLSFDDDVLVPELSGYEVRIRAGVHGAIDDEIRSASAARPPEVETGGTLFGAIDPALRIIWVDRATGPPPDSTMSTVGFRHGRRSLAEDTSRIEQHSNAITTFVGMWHTHPTSPPEPSTTDRDAMARFVNQLEAGSRQTLLLVLGGPGWTNYLAGAVAPRRCALVVTRDDNGAGSEPTSASEPPSWANATWWAAKDSDINQTETTA